MAKQTTSSVKEEPEHYGGGGFGGILEGEGEKKKKEKKGICKIILDTLRAQTGKSLPTFKLVGPNSKPPSMGSKFQKHTTVQHLPEISENGSGPII